MIVPLAELLHQTTTALTYQSMRSVIKWKWHELGGLLGFNASATARVIPRQWNDDDEISFLVEETGVPGGNHRPTASNWWNFSHIRQLGDIYIKRGQTVCLQSRRRGNAGCCPPLPHIALFGNHTTYLNNCTTNITDMYRNTCDRKPSV